MGEQARAQTLAHWSNDVHASSHAGSTTAGKLAAQGWLHSRLLSGPGLTSLHVEVSLGVLAQTPPVDFDEQTETRLRIEIYSEEWGVFFCHGGKASWIRVTDIAFAHGRDDFGLLSLLPPLKEVASLVRLIERQHDLVFRRDHPLIRSSLPGAERAVRAWVRTL